LSSKNNQNVIYISLQKVGCSEGRGEFTDLCFRAGIFISPHMSHARLKKKISTPPQKKPTKTKQQNTKLWEEIS